MRAPVRDPLFACRGVIEEKVREAADVFSLRMRLPDRESFLGRAGQFNMLGIPGVGEAAISFSSLPAGKAGFSHTIKAVGNVTEALCRQSIGDIVQIRGPFGKGWPIEKALGKHVAIVAGGIGLAPLRPALQHLLKNRARIKGLSLLYGSRSEDDILFKSDLRDWRKGDRLSVLLSVDEAPRRKSARLSTGVVTVLLDKVDLPIGDTIVFVCGPDVMIRFVTRHLLLKGHDQKDIFVSLERRMKCGFAHCGHCQIGAKFVCRDGPVFAYRDLVGLPDA